MQKRNILHDVEKLLKSTTHYTTDDGKLIKATVYTDIMKMDKNLISLLLSDETVKEQFFIDINGTLVFDKQKFAWFIESKEFLPDSYTQYTNKIGLTANNTFLSQSNDVVLDFPYKDCVLEGGQDKNDQKRSEIFYNETIASEEIHQMLAPKVLTNGKRFHSGGVQDAITFNDRDNLIIKGNNLIALASLLKRYEGKVKCIYIDPPYNTGNDSFNYNDSFNHSTWLTFMKNRLELAYKLLHSDGVIFVQCDDNEQAYLKILMDEVFGREKFVSTIHCQMSTTQGMKVKAAQSGNIVKNAEYIIVFSKDGHKNVAINPLYDLRPEYDEHYSLYLKEDGTIGQLKDLYDYRFPEDLNNKKALKLKEAFKKSEIFAEIVRTHLAEIVRSDKVTGFDISEGLENGKWKEIERGDRKYILTKDKNGKIQQLLRLSDSWGPTDNFGGEEGLRKIRGDWWEGFYIDMGNVGKEGAVDFKNGKKSERLVSQIIKMATNRKDLVLDFHLGSGTTAAVAHKMGRQYVGIEQMDYIEDITVERLKKVIAGEQGGISKTVNWQGGGSFVYCELKEDSQSLVEDIQSATDETIRLLKEKIYTDNRIVSHITTNELINADAAFDELSLEDKKRVLMTLIDKNKLYVNYSDIDDIDYQISDADKVFTKSFYEEV